MARVTKPCPACKSTEYPRDKDGICSECERIIAWAKMRQADDAKKNGEEISVMTKERHYALPRYNYEHGHIKGDTEEKVSKALHTLLMTMMRRGGDHNIDLYVPAAIKKSYSPYEWRIPMIIRKDQAEAVNALDDAFREFVAAVSQAGYEEGRNLLLSIAGGKISMDELNNEHIPKKG